MITYRNIRMVLGVFLSSICMFACQNTDEGVNALKNPIKLKGEIMVSSRVTDLNLQSTEFVDGQKVGITIDNAQSMHNNVEWEVDAKGNLNCLGTDVSWGNDEIMIYAYHPYSAGMGTNGSFSVSTDQSTDEGYLNSDLLWTKKSAIKTNNPINLSFTHKLTKLNIKLESNDIEDLKGAIISVCGTNIATLFNPLTGELLPSEKTDVKDIKASVTIAGAYQASCIIIPQSVSAGTAFIKVEHAGIVYVYKLPETIVFYGGKVYTFTLTISKNNPGDVSAKVPDMPWG